MRSNKLMFSLFPAALYAASAMGQATSGDLVGTVKDASGAVIPNASIRVTSESTGVTTSITSTASGEFRASNLLPARYDIAVSAPGFQALDLKGVEVDLNKTATADVKLSVGTATTVEVSADSGVVLDTTSTNLTTTFSNQELQILPTASVGGGVLNASLLSPGVASGGGLGIGTGPSVGGQRPRNNNFTIEGIDNNDKAVTGPLVYVPNDAVGEFTLITNQFSPEFGHSSGGQFNTNVLSGTNQFHGTGYEYFQNRNLNAAGGIAGGKVANPRYDNNRYGGELGGPILHDKLFFFANYERNAIGQSLSYFLCTPTAAGLSTLTGLATPYGFSANNVQQYEKYTPAANYYGGAQVTADNDLACGNQAAGPQSLSVTGANGAATDIPLGNYHVDTPTFSNFGALATSADYNITSKDSLRVRYIYNNLSSQDTAANLPVFFSTTPYKYHLVAISEYHNFTPNLTNEFRVGFNRFANTTGTGNFTYPGVDQFPNLTFYDQNSLNLGPDPNAPQFTIQNLYEATDNIGWVKGKHTIKIGFDGRKYISPQGFTQRARGDYQWVALDQFLHDLAPDQGGFAQRSSGSHTYYGDQSALYGYGNDTWRVTPTLTINAGLRYEFTSVPVGERAQQLNIAASVPGLVNFNAPKPNYTNFAPRIGINWAPDEKTSIRAGFGIAYDVLFDNLGTLSFPPQYSTTQNVGQGLVCSATVTTGCVPDYGAPNFLANGGLPPGKGSGITSFPATTDGLAAQRLATSAYLPNQTLPYAETYTLTVQRTIGANYTAEIGYEGTRGIHLATQDQINKQPRVTAQNQLPTYLTLGGTPLVAGGAGATDLADIKALSNIVPAWQQAGFLNTITSYQQAGFLNTITSYQPYSSSNYNALVANLTRRFQHGLQTNFSYTWSKTMDDATDEVFATVLTPRRQQNSQCISCDQSRSALDRTHRVTLEALYDLPFYKTSHNFLLKNLVGNWQISPIYTYESPEYATALSGDNANLNGDSGSAIDRPMVNPNGAKGTGSGVTAIKNGAGQTTGYVATNPNAFYIQAGQGTLPTASRNTLPIRPIDNVDVAAYKRLTFFDRYNVQVGAQAFNVLNHAQYIPGSIDNVVNNGYTASYGYQTVTNAFFNQPQKVFSNNPRTLQLSAKFSF